MEVSHEALGQFGSSTGRRCRCADEHEVVDSLPKKLGTVVESAFVNKLAKELDRRLCTVSLYCWHVNIIDIDDAGGISLSADQLLSLLFVELALDRLLSGERVGLS